MNWDETRGFLKLMLPWVKRGNAKSIHYGRKWKVVVGITVITCAHSSNCLGFDPTLIPGGPPSSK